MSTILKHRRGTTAQHASFTGAVGEITVDTDKDTAVVHDGTTVGGFPLLAKTMTDGTANGVAYLNGSKVLTTGSALTFDGSTLAATGSLSIQGNTTLGNATSDTISANGRFNTDVVPSTDNARDLGTTALKWRQVYATAFTENGFGVVSQTDIGTAPNEIPLNQYLGEMAYMNAEAVVIQPQASVTPNGIGDMVFQLTSDTSLVIKVKGSDGTVRSVALTLA
jgi:hypothetical protein